MKFCLGKLPARPPQGLKFADVINAAALPTPPATFGHQSLMADGNWNMLGNDSVGDCTLCDAAHQHMLWTMEGGIPGVRFETKGVLSDYFAITGGPDIGCDLQAVAAYRQKIGVIDATGVRHKIECYTSLRVGDITQLAQATYIFGAVSVGVLLPSSAEAQFIAGEPWSLVPTDKPVGGHCITSVGRDANGNYLFISWGRVQAATPEWVANSMDEAISPFSREILNAKGISPESYDLAALQNFSGEI